MKKVLLSLFTFLIAALTLCSCSGNPEKVSDSENLIKDLDVSSTSSETDYTYKSAEAALPSAYSDFQKNAISFSMELLKTNYSINEDKTVLAPANAYLQLGLIANGSLKDTKNEITNALGKSLSLEQLNQCAQYFQSRLAYFRDTSEEELYLTNFKNALWCNDIFDIKKDFLKTDAKYYAIDLYRFLFTDSNSLGKINNWTKDNSSFDSDAIDTLNDNAYMYQTSTLQIKDNWLEDYATKNVQSGTFNGSDGTSEVTYNASSEYLLKDDNSTGFIKSFKNTPLKLCVILPNEDISLSDYINNINSDSFINLIDSMDVLTKCNAYLPDFSKSTSVDLTDSLQNMGIKSIFTEEARLDNMTKTENVHLSQMIQSFDFQISANGISSSEIKEKTTADSDLNNKVTVKADRPFIFAVIDNESNIPLYLGVVENI